MKKLIIREILSLILVLGVFLIVFSLLGGWKTGGQERYIVALIPITIALLAAWSITPYYWTDTRGFTSTEILFCTTSAIFFIIVAVASPYLVVTVTIIAVAGPSYIIPALISPVVSVRHNRVILNALTHICGPSRKIVVFFSAAEVVIVLGVILGVVFLF